jgi:hypothetical protein
MIGQKFLVRVNEAGLIEAKLIGLNESTGVAQLETEEGRGLICHKSQLIEKIEKKTA